MIQTSLGDVVTLLSTAIDALAEKIEVCERGQGATEEVTTLNAVIAELRRNIN